MDLTPQHIEMVSAAGDIQKLWKPANGDYFIDLRLPGGRTEIYSQEKAEDFKAQPEPEFGEYVDVEFCSWIPRLDQYQDMAYNLIGLGWILFFAACTETYNQLCTAFHRQLEIFPETIALMLIMDRKFNLAWDSREKKWKKASQILRV